MATPEPLVPSRRLQSAAAAERERLLRELSRLDARAGVLADELQQINSRCDELRDQLALLARFSSSEEDSAFPVRKPSTAGHLQPVRSEETPRKAILRGARIREVAVILLASSPQPRRPIHYQKWYELVRDAGYAVAGRDPQATFLTQISRSPVIRRADAPGTYALDFDAPRALRAELGRLRTRLLEISSDSTESTDDVTRVRKQRHELDSMTRRLERELEEALRVLANAPTDSAVRSA